MVYKMEKKNWLFQDSEKRELNVIQTELQGERSVVVMGGRRPG